MDVDDWKTFHNQILWEHTQKASSFNSEHILESNQSDSIQVLCPTRVYHFDDTNESFVKDLDENFIKRMKKLSIISSHVVFDLTTMIEGKLESRVMCVLEL